MTQENYKAKAQLNIRVIKKLMMECVRIRTYACKVMNSIHEFIPELQKEGEEKNIRSTIAPLQYEAPDVYYLKETVDSIIKGINRFCELNDPQHAKHFSLEIERIYLSMYDAEAMFDQDELRKLPEWQSRL